MNDWAEALLSGLRQAGLTAEPEDVADSLWLALKMRAAGPPQPAPAPPPKPPEPKVPELKPPEIQSPSPPQSDQSAPPAPATEAPRPAAERLPLHLPARRAGAAGGGRTFVSPAARALPDSLALLRSLRPLMRRVPSRHRLVLDEVETVRRVAEEGIWMPAVRPARERWLRLCLVVDAGGSMGVWTQTVSELFKLLHGSGAFLHVTPWTLDTEGIPRLYAGLRPKAGVARGRSLRELIDPSGRSAVLVLSDCVGAAWYDGRVAGVLEEWGRRMPLAVVQVLPEYLWARTALGQAERAFLTPSGAAVPNSRLRLQGEDWPGAVVLESVPVPVLTLEPAVMSAWSRLLAGHPDARLPGVTLATQPLPVPQGPTAELSAKERVERFWQAASPLARKLAGLLAAAPVISLPVLRLVRQALLAQARQVHEAEVLLGDLLCVIDESADADEVRYDFHPGVRELLLDAVPTPSMLSVLERVSRYVESHLGMGMGFRAMLLDPASAAGSVVPSDGPFARVAAEVLERLGGDYARLVHSTAAVTPATGEAKATPTTEPTRWVLVAGEVTHDLSEDLDALSQRVGCVLGEEGYGLVTGGWTGVDKSVTRAFLEAGQGTQLLRQVLVYDWLIRRSVGEVIRVPLPRRAWHETSQWYEPAIERADVVVLIGYGDETEGASESARRLGKPVLPLARRATLGRIPDEGELRRLLRTVLSSGEEESPPHEDQPPAQPPRVQITYEIEKSGVTERRELPFLIGVLADLSGTSPRPDLRERPFLLFTWRILNDILRGLVPTLVLHVPEGGTTHSIDLQFRHLDDFHPERLVKRLAFLEEAWEPGGALLGSTFANVYGPGNPDLLPQEYWAEVKRGVDEATATLAARLRAILHHPEFQRLEATWRGIRYLLQQADTEEPVKILVLDVSKQELAQDLAGATTVYSLLSESALYDKIVTQPIARGEPFGLLLGDYEFDHSPDDMALLHKLSRVAAAAHAPFVAGPQSAAWKSFRATARFALFEEQHAAWKSFRGSEGSYFTALTGPRLLARFPYSFTGAGFSGFSFEEMGGGFEHNRCLWMNAIWAYGARVAAAFSRDGWFARTHGRDGGQVEGLPAPSLATESGKVHLPELVELPLGEREGINLSDLGFLPLVRLSDPDFIGFLSTQSCHESRHVSARLDYRLCVSRFVHCAMLMARNRAASFATLAECERWLNEWINGYVLAEPSRWEDDLPSRCPLAEGHIELRERDDVLEIHMLVRPHYQLESPAESVRVVATIPNPRR